MERSTASTTLSRSIGTLIPNVLRISTALRMSTSNTAPSTGLSRPYTSTALTAGDRCPYWSTRLSRCSSQLGFQGRS